MTDTNKRIRELLAKWQVVGSSATANKIAAEAQALLDERDSLKAEVRDKKETSRVLRKRCRDRRDENDALKAEVGRLRNGLEQIAKHHELVGGELAQYSGTMAIVRKALAAPEGESR